MQMPKLAPPWWRSTNRLPANGQMCYVLDLSGTPVTGAPWIPLNLHYEDHGPVQVFVSAQCPPSGVQVHVGPHVWWCGSGDYRLD